MKVKWLNSDAFSGFNIAIIISPIRAVNNKQPTNVTMLTAVQSSMVSKGNHAPDFTIPLAGGNSYNDVSSFTLSEVIGNGPIVLAFVPGAFTGGCTEELCEFGNELESFEALDALIYGISVDLPFAQNVWIAQEGFDIPMLSDWNHEVIQLYDVVYKNMYGSIESAQRSIFIIDSDGIVTYRWVREDSNPQFNRFVGDIRKRVEEARH